MAKSRRRRATTPHMLLWSRPDQRRFIDAVEAICAMRHDLQQIVEQLQELLRVKYQQRAARKRRSDTAVSLPNGKEAEVTHGV